MIQFEKNNELDSAMKHLILSMVEENEYLSLIISYTNKVLTPKMEKELIRLQEHYHIPQTNLRYNLKRLTDNPYYRDIRLDAVNTPTVRYENATIRKRTLMSMKFNKPLGKYLFHYHPIGYFDVDVHLPVLKEGDGTVWMSPAVSEIESMGDGLKKGHGKCMTMGLGIGFLPYLWLHKDEVESVTVIECNQDVIDLFESYIRPQFKTRNNLEIIHGNALDYYRADFLNQFDYVYADFWESSEDGLLNYTKLMEKKVDVPHVDFWVEDAMLSEVKYLVAPFLNTLYQGGSIREFIAFFEGNDRCLVKKINQYFKTRQDVIKTEYELLNLIHSKPVLRAILGQ